MRGLSGAVLLFGLAVSAQAQIQKAGEVALAGRLPFGATPMNGAVLVPNEDQSLNVLGPDASVWAKWNARSRFSAVVTASPEGTLAAVPQASGRVDVLVWDERTRVLAAAFASSRASPALATAWSSDGVYFGWKDGIEAWTRSGTLRWQTRSEEASVLLADESLGVYAFAAGAAVLYDIHGQETGRWTFQGAPRGVLQSTAGILYVWTDAGVWAKAPDDASFALIRSARPLGVVIDRQDRLVVTTAAELTRLSPEGSLISTIKLPRGATTPAVLDDRGRLAVGTAAGLEVWTYEGKLENVLEGVPASAAAITPEGWLVWGTTDWKVNVWRGFRLPPYGWPQDGGAGRSFNARRPDTVAVRHVRWDDNAEFNYLYQLAASGEEDKQRQVLDLLEAIPVEQRLTQRPYANLLLLKVARSGLTDLQVQRNRVLNSWPSLRLRAYALLARTARPDDRAELIDLVRLEYDPAAAAQGALALAGTGWDGDGQLLRMLAELLSRMPDQTGIAEAVLEAARSLWTANGKESNPSLISLVTSVYQGPYPRTLKSKAQGFFQDLLLAD